MVDRRPVARKDYKAIRDTRNEIKDDREQLRKQRTELEKDRAELRRDIRSGASKTEIMKDRKELRDDVAQIRKTREELTSDRARFKPPVERCDKTCANDNHHPRLLTPKAGRNNACGQPVLYLSSSQSSPVCLIGTASAPFFLIVSGNDRD